MTQFLIGALFNRRFLRNVVFAYCVFIGHFSTALAQLLEPVLDKARSRAAGLGPALCKMASGESLNVFFLRPMRDAFGALDYAAIEAVLFNHPLANVFVLVAAELQEDVFDRYLKEGYCVVSVLLDFAWLRAAVVSFEPSLDWDRFATLVDKHRALPFFLNCALMALQIAYGGISLDFYGLLLNPFDMMLPQPLTLQNTAMFLEKTLAPEEPTPSISLEKEDFDRSWAPRSHTDRADGRTLICGDHQCPRSISQANPLAKHVLSAWFEEFLRDDQIPAVDHALTRLYKQYVRTRQQSVSDLGMLTTPVEGYAALALPGWVIVEPHFPDGWRYYGNRGNAEESEDRPQFHSQLYSPRAHREKSDWWLVRSLKLWLALDYGPPTARNVMPRSVVDLTRRLISLRISPYVVGPLNFGAAASAPQHSAHAIRSTVDVFRALDNSMTESLGIGVRPPLPQEIALPGAMGGFRTFRDIRVVGQRPCLPDEANQVRISLNASRLDVGFFCQALARPEGGAPGTRMIQSDAHQLCQRGVAGSRVQLSGTPALVNAAMSLLAYRPISGLGRNAPLHSDASQLDPDQRLDASELEAHFAKFTIELESLECGKPLGQIPRPNRTSTTEFKGMIDDVEDQITVVAHSAERCELLERLGVSFRLLYSALPVVVTCECTEEANCVEPAQRMHPSIPHMTIVDVPYDFGLSRGKRLLAQLVTTEFVLVLDDDFVRSPLSCLECMVWHMRSHIHSVPLPFDMLGFPILEDERNFGAFRGRLRAGSGRLLLETVVSDATVDGCVRVGIHPMAFLARTTRFRGFKFQDHLQVGEHEHFFYANRYLGLHAAVCFDSTFPHFRVQMSGNYKKRRERMQELMALEFEKIGFPSVMYLLHKYDALSAADRHEFIQQDIPPWQISDDTCGPQADPPADFSMFFAVIFSTADEQGAQFRQLLRGTESNPSSAWLPRLAAVTNVKRAFFVPGHAQMLTSLAQEDEVYGDLILMPDEEGASTKLSARQCQFALTFLREFQFRWLLVARQDTFVHLEALWSVLVGLDPPARTIVGGWRHSLVSGTNEKTISLLPHFFAMTHDVHHLLTSHRMARWLRIDFENGIEEALNAWFAPLSVQRSQLSGVYSSRSPGRCPTDMTVLHPVTPEELHALSEAALQGTPCAAFAFSEARS